jgi:dihydrofolate synthase/folylpolyglutamate synthase
VSHKPLVICDTGHNLAGWEILSRQISETFDGIKRKEGDDATLHIVFGMVDDKDIDHVLQLLPRDAVYYFTQAETHRAIPVEQLAAKAYSEGLKGKVYKSVKEAFNASIKEASQKDFIFVGGSSYVVADFLS